MISTKGNRSDFDCATVLFARTWLRSGREALGNIFVRVGSYLAREEKTFPSQRPESAGGRLLKIKEGKPRDSPSGRQILKQG